MKAASHALSSRTILITGCSTGIGLHCARRLRDNGWQVFATARKSKDIENLKHLGLDAVHLDYTSEKSIEACAEYVLNKSENKLFALFNNGAYGQPGALEDLPVDALRLQFETNFFGWHELTRRLIPAMRAQKNGRIIQCSSVLGVIALKYRGAYNASKFALEGYTDTLRLELHGNGIKVISIQPGPVTSKFRENARKAFIENIDIQNSVHKSIYEKRLEKMNRSSPDRFELGPEAVYKKLEKALNAKRPAHVYRVTFPAHFMAYAKRILSTRLMHTLALKVSDSE
jgi:NAD(P)-dependent dehydrogenase (short-subunit alcohol dehydrogenase family)